MCTKIHSVTDAPLFLTICPSPFTIKLLVKNIQLMLLVICCLKETMEGYITHERAGLNCVFTVFLWFMDPRYVVFVIKLHRNSVQLLGELCFVICGSRYN